MFCVILLVMGRLRNTARKSFGRVFGLSLIAGLCMGASLEEDLGSEDFEVREKARGELWSEGEKNRNLLENLS